MHDSHHRLSSSKSLGQIPPVRYNPSHSAHHNNSHHHREPPSTSHLATLSSTSYSHRSRDRVSISNLINAVDNTRITSVPSSPTLFGETSSTSAKHSTRHRSSSLTRNNPHHNDELTMRRKKIQSEKKRLWRKNLSPDQKAKRQELDAQRKREQRMNMTPDQRAEARRKDAARKAAKRRLQKEQQLRQQRDKQRESSSSSSSPPPPHLQMNHHSNHNVHAHFGRPTPLTNLPNSPNVRPDLALSSPSSPVDFDSASFSRSKIQDLLN